MNNKKIFYFVLFGMAVICYFFANNRSFPKMLSSNVEALVSVSNSEYYGGLDCGIIVEEWLEPINDKAQNLHYTGANYMMDCNDKLWRCDLSRTGANKGAHDENQKKCYHPQPSNYPTAWPQNSQNW